VPVETAKRLRDTVKWFMVSEELVSKGHKVVVACSGGADSMALLSLLHALSGELGITLAVAYFDHRIRDENERDFVAACARKLGLSFYGGEADVPALAAESGDSIEAAARKARYAFLHDVAARIGAARIATGHTQDDQAETVIMRVLRGAGIRGLAGIPIRRGKVIRPLLRLTREDTQAYCRAREIDTADDPTNEDRHFLRNRVRHELLPLLEADYLGGVRGNLVRLADNARDMVDEIRERTQPLIAQNLKRNPEGEWLLNVTRIATLDRTSLVILFGDIFANELGCDLDYSRKHYDDLVALARNTRGSGKSLDLPGLAVKREYENLIFTRPRVQGPALKVSEHATLTLPGETTAAGVEVAAEILERGVLDADSFEATDRTAYFDLQKLRLPLTLRNPRSGDRMQPFGMSGSKKLSDIFIDRKIPGRQRGAALVVEDAEEILWLVGVTTAEKSRVAPGTDKIVRITVQPR